MKGTFHPNTFFLSVGYINHFFPTIFSCGGQERRNCLHLIPSSPSVWKRFAFEVLPWLAAGRIDRGDLKAPSLGMLILSQHIYIYKLYIYVFNYKYI